MPNERSRNEFRLGFLTAIHVAEQGHVGGLLVTNRYARPLEFQCTTPVQPNRSQEILYGPTLVPYVLNELIGKTLVEKVEIKPELLFVDRSELLELQEHIGIAVAYVTAKPSETEAARCETASSEEPQEPALTVGQSLLYLHPQHGGHRPLLEKCRQLLSERADLLEPFQRIHEALKEVSTPVRTRAVPA